MTHEKTFPEGDANRAAILKGYLKMMEGLRANLNGDGIWNQLIDDKDFWPESSGSAMFTYAMIRGVKNGWLDAEIYAPIVRPCPPLLRPVIVIYLVNKRVTVLNS